MPEPVIHLDNVSIRYRLARHRIPSFKEYAIHWMRGALTYEELWALKGINLSIQKGESIGIVGRNGAGKSTLLKVISRILKPIEGTVSVVGQVAPILELGTGFDYELSGLENIRLNSLLLGRRKSEVERSLDDIVEFSELGDFIHSPIRSYSSGMVARLGFAIASIYEPDILILDEILAVGDTGFQVKCQKRLAELKASGTTILMVSHAGAITEHCDRCLWLDQGRVQANGDPHEVMGQYLQLFQGSA